MIVRVLLYIVLCGALVLVGCSDKTESQGELKGNESLVEHLPKDWLYD